MDRGGRGGGRGGGGGGGRAPDWNCPNCRIVIWGSKDECAKCHAPNPARVGGHGGAAAGGGGGGGGRAPDWYCNTCKMTIWGSKDECAKCHTPNPARQRAPAPAAVAVAAPAPHAAPVGHVGHRPDWHCVKCQIVVFGSKDECLKCHTRNPHLPPVAGAAVPALAAAAPATVLSEASQAAPKGRLPDWNCPNCKMVIWGSKIECTKCLAPNPGLAARVAAWHSNQANAPAASAPAVAAGGGDGTKGASECVVCLDQMASHVGKECGHRCVCAVCCTSLTSCPVCRKQTGFIKLYDV